MRQGDATTMSRALAWVRNAVIVFRILRMPILVVIFTGLCLLVPEQTREVYRAIAQDVLLYGGYAGFGRVYRELSIAFCGLLAIAITVWLVASLLAKKFAYLVPPEARPALQWAPRALVFLLFVLAAAGVYFAQTGTLNVALERALVPTVKTYFNVRTDEGAKDIVGQLFAYNQFLAFGAFVIAAAGAILAVCLPVAWITSSRLETPNRASLYGRWPSVAVFGVILSVVGLLIAPPVYIPKFLGPLGISSIFVICLTVVLGQLSYWTDKHGVPYTLGLILVALSLSLLDINDNHTIDRVGVLDPPQSAPSGGPAPQLANELDSWYRLRPDRARFEQRNRPYPVYIVAAQGGGIYAAFHTASILGNIQDHCPAFAQHVFAISSVSGGSVGASVFAGLVKHATIGAGVADPTTLPCTKKELPLEASASGRSMLDLTDEILSNDLLSPLLTGLLFPDFLQRFLPYPFTSLDRALHLELGFEHAMQEILDRRDRQAAGRTRGRPRNFLSAHYLNHWKPGGTVPALIINTTEVGSGRRRVIAPFEFAQDSKSLVFLPIFEDFKAGTEPARLKDLPVSTAVILSARFPWITPAGTFYEFARDHETGRIMLNGAAEPILRKVRLVDGGYFENSGVATALDLIRAMEDVAKRPEFPGKIQIHLIVLTGGTYPEQKFFGLSEATSPVQALLNTRTTRAYITIAEAERELNRSREEKQPLGPRPLYLRRILLQDFDYRLPLGWRLSPITMLLIRAQTGIIGQCNHSQGNRGQFDADCLLQAIASEL